MHEISEMSFVQILIFIGIRKNSLELKPIKIISTKQTDCLITNTINWIEWAENEMEKSERKSRRNFDETEQIAENQWQNWYNMEIIDEKVIETSIDNFRVSPN